VGLLTIGSFARASRLSPKALRLYDELGLLPPAHIDPASGYRFYDPAQLEQARLVAWLRRLGMPLARIRVVCGLAPAAAADEVAAFWASVEAETVSRRDLAAFLIGYLSRKDTAMSDAHETPDAGATSGGGVMLGIRYSALSDIGRQRETNQDSVYAGSRLLAVADGWGSHGEAASAAVIDALKPLESAVPAGDLLNALEHAVSQASSAVSDIDAPSPGNTGTTLTAMLWSGSQLALVHIGDTRAYLLRDGELFQITHDHTVVQSLLDGGRITREEATSHPQRSLLLRGIDGSAVAADTSLHDARVGDRYLLCSDGLTTVVATREIERALRQAGTPDRTVRQLVDLANQGGGPDNIGCVVADVVDLGGDR
jgi:serine/threonine protein phosphatase PrpC/DNA-binding transcriptional MerR regulator